MGEHILNLRIFAAEIFVSKQLIFADGTKTMIYFKFFPVRVYFWLQGVDFATGS